MGWLLLATLIGGATASAYDLAQVFRTGELWTYRRYDIPEQSKTQQMYLQTSMSDMDDTKTQLTGNDGKIEFGGIILEKVECEWKAPEDTDTAADDQADSQKATELYRITAMVYSRIENLKISLRDYQTTQKNVKSVLNKEFGSSGRKGALSASQSAMRTETLTWENEHGAIRMESVANGRKPELIRIVMAPSRKELDRGSVANKQNKRDLKANVVTDPDGTVWIKGIPMIEQGNNTNSEAVTMARVLAYYGMDGMGVHELSVLLDERQRRKSVTARLEMLLKVKIKHITRHSGLSIMEAISAYNREASKARLPQLPAYDYAKSRYSIYQDTTTAIDENIWCKVIVKNMGDVKKYMTSIHKSIDAGIPLLWRVWDSQLYTGSKTPGTEHVRMIIGYNAKKNTLIYSDPWGKGHEKKEMKEEHAYAISASCYALQP